MNLSRWWQPWTWCRTWRPHRCILRRYHFGRHARSHGFGVRWFDTIEEGTP